MLGEDITPNTRKDTWTRSTQAKRNAMLMERLSRESAGPRCGESARYQSSRAERAEIFAANERMNQMLIEELAPRAWKAKPPGNVRSIAAIFTHMHNVRRKWVRLTAPHLQVPVQLNRAHCTPEQARVALAESGARCVEMLRRLWMVRVVEFGVCEGWWANPWPVGKRCSVT